VRKYLDGETFCMTYGDGVGNIDISALISSHRSSGKLATVTAVQPTGRFGIMKIEDARVTSFHEKPSGDGAWVNGGFFVLEPAALDYVAGDDTAWEDQPMKDLVASHQLTAYAHDGFWQAMDTLRDKMHLEKLWSSGAAPWKIW
jgi:glucose-1-phosphate cytidylyltransferase